MTLKERGELFIDALTQARELIPLRQRLKIACAFILDRKSRIARQKEMVVEYLQGKRTLEATLRRAITLQPHTVEKLLKQMQEEGE